jgi:hypothetical protein
LAIFITKGASIIEGVRENAEETYMMERNSKIGGAEASKGDGAGVWTKVELDG